MGLAVASRVKQTLYAVVSCRLSRFSWPWHSLVLSSLGLLASPAGNLLVQETGRHIDKIFRCAVAAKACCGQPRDYTGCSSSSGFLFRVPSTKKKSMWPRAFPRGVSTLLPTSRLVEQGKVSEKKGTLAGSS